MLRLCWSAKSRRFWSQCIGCPTVVSGKQVPQVERSCHFCERISTTQLSQLDLYRLILFCISMSRFLGSWHSVQVSSLLPIEATFKGLQTCKSRSDQVWWQKMKLIEIACLTIFNCLFSVSFILSHYGTQMLNLLASYPTATMSFTQAWKMMAWLQQRRVTRCDPTTAARDINVQCALPGRSCTCHFCGKMMTAWQCDVFMGW